MHARTEKAWSAGRLKTTVRTVARTAGGGQADILEVDSKTGLVYLHLFEKEKWIISDRKTGEKLMTARSFDERFFKITNRYVDADRFSAGTNLVSDSPARIFQATRHWTGKRSTVSVDRLTTISCVSLDAGGPDPVVMTRGIRGILGIATLDTDIDNSPDNPPVAASFRVSFDLWSHPFEEPVTVYQYRSTKPSQLDYMVGVI